MNEQPERIWIHFWKSGYSPSIRSVDVPVAGDVEYVRADLSAPVGDLHYAVFEAGWNAGFQEALEPDRFPEQNRCEVLYRESFPAAPESLTTEKGE